MAEIMDEDIAVRGRLRWMFKEVQDGSQQRAEALRIDAQHRSDAMPEQRKVHARLGASVATSTGMTGWRRLPAWKSCRSSASSSA